MIITRKAMYVMENISEAKIEIAIVILLTFLILGCIHLSGADKRIPLFIESVKKTAKNSGPLIIYTAVQ